MSQPAFLFILKCITLVTVLLCLPAITPLLGREDAQFANSQQTSKTKPTANQLGGTPSNTNVIPVNVTKTSSKKNIPLFENIELSPKFKPDPQILRGISGGTEEVQKQSGKAQTETGACLGFIDSIADHKLTLTTGFSYLKMKVFSSGDTILLVRGPGGSWCSDDVSDRNPEVAGQWLAGTYEIWVGSYEANASHPYLLQITEVK